MVDRGEAPLHAVARRASPAPTHPIVASSPPGREEERKEGMFNSSYSSTVVVSGYRLGFKYSIVLEIVQ